MHVYKTPGIVRWLTPGLVWRMNTSVKKVYLTFDDGPVPGVTDWVLDVLLQFNAKATFFVVGENVSINRDLYSRILSEEHSVGNHTYNHLNAWKHNNGDYLENIDLCEREIGLNDNKSLFRPPHGKLTPGLIKEIRKNHSIIMWDVLSGDYESSISPELCLKRSLKGTSNGSIVVFHDSYKSENKLKAVLPAYLEELTNQGHSFASL